MSQADEAAAYRLDHAYGAMTHYRTRQAPPQNYAVQTIMRPAPPTFPPISLGQVVRAAVLVLLCLGFAQLSHAERAPQSVAVASVDQVGVRK